MNLIDVQGGGINRVLGKLLAEGGIAPAETGNIIELAGRARTGFGVESVGIRFHADLPVSAGNGIFIGCVGRQIGDKAFPNLALAGEFVGFLIPVVEVAYHGYGLGVGSPHPEHPAFPAPAFLRMGAKPFPAVRQCSCVEQIGFFRHVKTPLPTHNLPFMQVGTR